MKDFKKVKAIAESFFALSVELLELVDEDENERTRIIENVKKTPTGKYFISQAWRRPNTTIILCKNRQYD